MSHAAQKQAAATLAQVRAARAREDGAGVSPVTATPAQVRGERDRVSMEQESHPSSGLASIMAGKHAEILARRPPPLPPQREPSELERRLRDGPQSTAQEIGHHAMPEAAPPPTPGLDPSKRGELEALRRIFPNSTQRELGFHHNFRDGRAQKVAEARAVAATLTPEHVKADPQLADAIAFMRSRVVNLDQRGLRPYR